METLLKSLVALRMFSSINLKNNNIWAVPIKDRIMHQVHYNKGIFYIYVAGEVQHFCEDQAGVIQYFKSYPSV